MLLFSLRFASLCYFWLIQNNKLLRIWVIYHERTENFNIFNACFNFKYIFGEERQTRRNSYKEVSFQVECFFCLSDETENNINIIRNLKRK